jgi:hypothetical protein
MKISLYSALATLVLISSCATAPTVQEQGAADYGEQPTHYEEAIHAYFDSTLKDPSSVQYRNITAPSKGYIRGPLIAGGHVTYGWTVSAAVNAKNSYGGYVGFRTYTFLFRGDKIVDMITPENE